MSNCFHGHDYGGLCSFSKLAKSFEIKVLGFNRGNVSPGKWNGKSFQVIFQPGFKGTWCIVMYAWVATPIKSRPWWSAFSLSRLALPRDATIRCEMNCEGTTVTCDMQTIVPWSNYMFLFQKGDGHQYSSIHYSDGFISPLGGPSHLVSGL